MKLYERKKIQLTNTMSGKREEFKPQAAPRVLFYSCGPTVYGPLHIGNARALITADLWFRWLKFAGFDVNFVRNYTDVDDKIIAKANEEKIPSEQVSEKYIEYCEEDMRRLGLDKPTKTVKVTESMDDIRAMIAKIVERGHGYVAPDGEVLFSVDSFKTYGKLSNKNVDELQAGARVEVDTKKKNPADFSLWKPFKPGEPFWKSPWCDGRPGWHIECSAMVSHWLGETIDIHHGGQDLIFPHHENEIAQSEAASGKPFCKYWVHNAFLTMGNEKMSKSLGNIFRIREFLEAWGPEVLKYIFVSHHYRSGIDFSDTLIAKTLDELERVYLSVAWAADASKANPSADGSVWKDLPCKINDTWSKIEDELCLDLNSPGALGHLFTLIREINRVETLAAGKPGAATPSSIERVEAAKAFLALVKDRLFKLWNVFGTEPHEMLKTINALRGKLANAAASGALGDAEIQKLILERSDAKKSKNFGRADEIRKMLDAQGIQLVDSPQGTTWKYK